MNYQEFWQRFLRAEQQAKAYRVRVLGMQVWPLLRTKIYYRIAQQVGLFDEPHPHPESPDAPAQPIAGYGVIPRARAVVVPFSRQVGGSDPYSDRVIEALQQRGKSHWVLRHHDPAATVDIHRLKVSFELWYEPGVARLMRRFAKQRPAAGWRRIVRALEAEFGIQLDKYREYPKWLFRRHLIEAYGYYRMFRAAGTRQLFLVNAYSHPSLVLGAKLALVRVSELQHGFISEYHPAYSFPAGTGWLANRGLRRLVQSAPHRLLVWGSYWTRSANLPLNTRALVSGPTVPFASARSKVLAARAAERGGKASGRQPANRITFTSQGALAGQLFAAAQHFARLLPDYQITYRLHPNESLDDYAHWQRRSPKNLTLSHRNPNFLDVLATTDYLVGGFSTTLYEGLAFGLPVLALELPGHENLGAAVREGDMQLMSPAPTEAELRAALAAAVPCPNPNRYYAELAESRRFPGV